MSKEKPLVKQETETPAALIEKVLLSGDLSKLTTEERLMYYNHVCTSVGLNPLTRPFEYLTLNNRLVLYASKNCTEQLRSIHDISVTKLERELLEGIYSVIAYGKNAKGREDSSIGAVNVENLKGEAKANAIMKCETKAKRRLTLSLCGLGMLDETEVETIPSAKAPPLDKPAIPAEATGTDEAKDTKKPAKKSTQELVKEAEKLPTQTTQFENAYHFEIAKKQEECNELFILPCFDWDRDNKAKNGLTMYETINRTDHTLESITRIYRILKDQAEIRVKAQKAADKGTNLEIREDDLPLLNNIESSKEAF